MGTLAAMFDPSPGPRARVGGPSPARIREIRAQRERERQYREYADYARTYGAAPELAGFSHFAGLSNACMCAGKPCAQMGMQRAQRALAAVPEGASFLKPVLVAVGLGLGMLYLVRRM